MELKNSIKNTLKSLAWGFVAIITAGSSCDSSKRVQKNLNTRSLTGTRGLWNDFANVAISSGNALKKASQKFKA